MPKKNPVDATRRNTQAANKKFKAVKLEIRNLRDRVKFIEKKLGIKHYIHRDPQ